MKARLRFNSSRSASSRARRASSSDTAGLARRSHVWPGIEEEPAGHGAVGTDVARFLADAIAGVVQQRALGGQLPALLVVALHPRAREGERLPDRHAAILVEVGLGLRRTPRRRTRRRPCRIAGRRVAVAVMTTRRGPASLGEERRAGRRRVHDHQTARAWARSNAAHSRGVEVGAHEVELRRDAVEGAVSDQHDERRRRPAGARRATPRSPPGRSRGSRASRARPLAAAEDGELVAAHAERTAQCATTRRLHPRPAAPRARRCPARPRHRR